VPYGVILPVVGVHQKGFKGNFLTGWIETLTEEIEKARPDSIAPNS